jgi:pyruvate/2-oxoglutarate/acetoin dehydrogenase E1 component/TPP-dependent pyruvate/acetoin dehydrogenase alpha subunit
MTETLSAPAGASARETVLADYRIGWESRHASLVGRREVLTGKAKFGIFGDGKELPQLAMAHAWRPGDWRSGYYRDQTLWMALGQVSLREYFAQLYADPDPGNEPHSAGRQMNAHFATRLLDERGEPRDQTTTFNTSADMSPTAGQMPRLVGLGYASRLYREIPGLATRTGFSRGGDEVAWGTIGNASCAEGHFWEAVNAIGVLRSPVVISIWDDGYGISVPNEFQLAKADLSEMLAGFQRRPGAREGFEVRRVPGWDYEALRATYAEVAAVARREHVPALVHVAELTQPQGHSTSGSHERYKSKERLAFESSHDGLARFRQWILERRVAEAAELDAIEHDALTRVRDAQRAAWEDFQEPIENERRRVVDLLVAAEAATGDAPAIAEITRTLERQQPVLRRHLETAVAEALIATRDRTTPAREALAAWRRAGAPENERRFSSFLVSEGPLSPLAVPAVPAVFRDDSPLVNGFEVVNACFDAALARMPHLVAFGEDLGKLGDVNQGFLGLQEKYGPLRVADTGIREQTIMGQATGLALRGVRSIAEIQYLDYVLYGLQTLSDDVATLRYRTANGQAAPILVRTRGHRLEGIWHSGSLLGGVLHLVRGMWVCVPRNMTQAAGMYNTLLAGDDPAIVVEVLNGYRLKERLPANIGEFTVPLGVPEILRAGSDATLVTYGACCRIALEAAEMLAPLGIEIEVIDVQTLLPFDRPGVILDSLRRTNRLLIVDEDVPGAASAYLQQQIVERQGGFWWLDAPPVTVTGKSHRPPYGSDGDYFAKPNREQIAAAAHALVAESGARRLPPLFD